MKEYFIVMTHKSRTRKDVKNTGVAISSHYKVVKGAAKQNGGGFG